MKAVMVIMIAVLLGAVQELELFYIPVSWPKPVYDFSKNPLTLDKINLGRALFYDPILSKDNTISCASCHTSYSAFTHVDHDLSHGIYDSIGTRNSPALMNLAWQSSFMWDGAIKHLDMQALAPISHPSEMASSITDVVEKLNNSKSYNLLFQKAYGLSEVTGEKTLKAISQFMLTLISDNAKYDRVMVHKDTFTAQEKNGYILYKSQCASCHSEPLFTNNQFANNGLPEDEKLKDKGRSFVTGNVKDTRKFKIPTLRNIEYTYPYMHDGRFKKLSEVLKHYTQGIQKSESLAVELRDGVSLSSNEMIDVIAFLRTLSDSSFVFNPKFQYPRELLTE